MDKRYALNIEQIQRFLPHRYPFLMVDRVLEIVPVGDNLNLEPANTLGIKVTAIKSVSINEPFFQGHFPGYSIMPGVLMIEMMAQAASFSTYPHFEGHLDETRMFQCILVGVDGARFRRPVVPGDTVRVETVVSKRRGMLWGFQCTALVDGQKVAEAEILANLALKEEFK